MANLGPSSASSPNIPVINGVQLLFVLRNANFAISTDQQFTRVFSGNTWDPFFITANQTSGAFSGTCAGGIFTLPSKGGSAIVAVGQSWAAMTGAFTHVNATIQAATTTFTTTPYLSLTTPNGAPLTGDVFIFGVCYDT